jgi:hypothetical protein
MSKKKKPCPSGPYCDCGIKRKPIHPKVKAAALGGALSTVLTWALSLNGIDLPPAVAAAIPTIVSALSGYGKSA